MSGTTPAQRAELERNRVLELCESRGEFHKGADGYWYYWPVSGFGHMAAHHLRWIADELDKRNEGWNKEIDKLYEKKA